MTDFSFKDYYTIIGLLKDIEKIVNEGERVAKKNDKTIEELKKELEEQNTKIAELMDENTILTNQNQEFRYKLGDYKK